LLCLALDAAFAGMSGVCFRSDPPHDHFSPRRDPAAHHQSLSSSLMKSSASVKCAMRWDRSPSRTRRW
jgi:hypothetical protein